MSVTKKEMRTTPKNFQDLVGRIKREERFDQEALRAQISDQISCLMTAQGVSRAEMAKRLRTSRAYVTKILQGNANFTGDSLVQIARVLGCKYVPVFVPVNEWTQFEAVHIEATTRAVSNISAGSYKKSAALEVKTENR